ncbi:MAG: ImmA/IrrE family metallo-endopeptidase [Ruminococcus sp.]|nr:ImmA/IrrE family metallo-endopeptidase [Ruminococcus sp.]
MIDKLKIFQQAIAIRKKLGESDSSPIDTFNIVQNIPHFSLVLYPMGKNISGMCVRIGKEAIIAINSSMSIGRQNFSIAHELYHYYFDEEQKTTICKMDIGKGNDIEKSADQFASYFLMPLGNEVIYKIEEEISFNKIIELEQYYKVSHQAMLYRLLGEGLISSEQLENYKNRKVVYAAASLGFDTALYKPSLEEKAYKTFGYYIKQAQRLLENEKISDGKYEQLLLEAFRSDLVYGKEQEEEELND